MSPEVQIASGRSQLLRLRPFLPEDEEAALAAHRALEADGFPFLLGYGEGDSWESYLESREANRRGEDLPERWVPSTLLAATVAGELVGRISIRHQLNDFLATSGGHIGYAVVPWERRRGYATEILRQGLVIARSYGVADVLITCDLGNVASARVIEACGGEFESVIDGAHGEEPKRRYWIR